MIFFHSSTEGFRLSLNGKAPLSQDGNTKLSDLGIVAGDLVHILMDPAGHNNRSIVCLCKRRNFRKPFNFVKQSSSLVTIL